MFERAWRFYLDDMEKFARNAIKYTAGLDQEKFEQNDLVYDATLRKNCFSD
jgi:uncharacterized protein with HEPN domain